MQRTLGTLLVAAIVLEASHAIAVAPTIRLSALDGATTPAEFELEVDVAGATTAKLVVDGVYIGERTGSPLRFDLVLAPGEHRARVRVDVRGDEVRVDAAFTVAGTAGPVAGSDAPVTGSDPPADIAGGRRRRCPRSSMRSSSTRPTRSARHSRRPSPAR